MYSVSIAQLQNMIRSLHYAPSPFFTSVRGWFASACIVRHFSVRCRIYFFPFLFLFPFTKFLRLGLVREQRLVEKRPSAAAAAGRNGAADALLSHFRLDATQILLRGGVQLNATRERSRPQGRKRAIIRNVESFLLFFILSSLASMI